MGGDSNTPFPMIRGIALLLTLVAPFFFPFALAVVLIAGSALLFPLLALLGGVLFDALYYIPHGGYIPVATLVGVAGFLVASVVQKLVRARIMGA